MTVTFKQLGNHGRMANGLFQVAATIALAYRNFDDFLFPHWPESKHFNIPEEHFIEGKHIPKNIKEYQEPCFAYKHITYDNNLNIHGYFQSYKYFDDFNDVIIKQLTPRHKSFFQAGKASIHVRRGDYLKFNKCYNILDMKYYEQAMELTGLDRFIIFSDDIGWCKKHFIGNQFEFSEDNPAHIDLSIMLKCEQNIIANSSYSWWGAYLNKSLTKKVISPKNWFGPELSPTHPITDLIPENWIQI